MLSRKAALAKGGDGAMTAQWENARAEELHNLRLALATFALQLDAFEMRASRALLAAGREAPMALARMAAARASQLKGSDGGK